MKRLLVAVVILASAQARADDAARAIPADAAIVATARPLAMLGVAARIGSAWEKLARRQLPIPPAVSPFDPTLLSTLGVDPAATTWASLRGLRGHVHVRGALPLSDKRLAEAVVRSGAAVANLTLEHTPAGAWIGHDERGVYVVRLDGSVLVVDLLLRGIGRLPTVAELQRLVPLRPPRAFDPQRGIARRMSPADAIAIWADLASVAQLGLIDGERKMIDALRGVAEDQRAKIEHAGRGELATCRAAMKAPPVSFDDLFWAIVVRGPDSVEMELALGGKHAALAGLHGKPVQGTRALLPAEVDTEVRVALTDAGPLRAALRPVPGAIKELVPRECPGPSRLALGLRVWPNLVGRLATAATGDEKRDLAAIRMLSGLRSAAIWMLPAAAATGEAAMEGGRRSNEVIALGEMDDAVRGDLDRLLAGMFGATTPLRAGGRQLTAYALPTFPWSDHESRIVAVDPLNEATGGALVGFGPRERLKAAYERVSRLTPADRLATAPIAKLSASPKALTELMRNAGQEALVDGLGQIDATLALDDEVLRLDVDVTLRPAPQGR